MPGGKKVALLTLETCLRLGKMSPVVAGVTWQGGTSFQTFISPAVCSGRSLKEGRNRMIKDRNTPSFLPSSPPTAHSLLLCAKTSCSVNSDVTRVLRHTAAGSHLRLLFLYWLFQFEEGWVAAGWRVVNRVAIGGDQWHAGVLGVVSGISEGVCGAVA